MALFLRLGSHGRSEFGDVAFLEQLPAAVLVIEGVLLDQLLEGTAGYAEELSCFPHCEGRLQANRCLVRACRTIKNGHRRHPSVAGKRVARMRHGACVDEW